MFVFKAAVVGAGAEGAEMAQAIAAAGVAVLLYDPDPERLDAGLARAREITSKTVAKQVERGRLTADAAVAEQERITALIARAPSYDGFGDVEFVVEAVPEHLELKHRAFADLDAATPGHAILASSTSAL